MPRFDQDTGAEISLDSDGTPINPATEETLAAIAASIGTARTASAPTAVTVGLTSASALTANANRKGCYLINTSTAFISLGFGAPAVLYSGITIPPMWYYQMRPSDDLVTAQIFAIASAAGSNLSIQEYV
jgi:hypothetical protein